MKVQAAFRRFRAGRSLLLVAAVAAACSGRPRREPRSDGERVYLNKCTACHDAYEPRDHSAATWSESVGEMERLKRVRLTPEERSLILGYLTGTERPKP